MSKSTFQLVAVPTYFMWQSCYWTIGCVEVRGWDEAASKLLSPGEEEIYFLSSCHLALSKLMASPGVAEYLLVPGDFLHPQKVLGDSGGRLRLPVLVANLRPASTTYGKIPELNGLPEGTVAHQLNLDQLQAFPCPRWSLLPVGATQFYISPGCIFVSAAAHLP